MRGGPLLFLPLLFCLMSLICVTIPTKGDRGSKKETSNSPSAAAARIIMQGTKREREVGDLDLIARA